MSPIRRDQPSWRRPDGREIHLGPVLAALGLLGMLLLEVWQSGMVRSLSVQTSETTRRLQLASAELEWTRSAREDGLDRAGVAPMAAGLGLRPTDPSQFVSLPEEYLADAAPVVAGAPRGLLASVGRALSPLVPDAQARGRDVN